MIDHLRYMAITSERKATPPSAMNMAVVAKRAWWNKNRKRYPV